MKNPTKFAIPVVMSLVAAAGLAATNNEIWGSPELAGLTQAILAQCPAAAPLRFVSVSSSSAEGRLLSAAQQIAPMGRFMSPELACQAPTPKNSHGAIPAVQPLQISANAATTQCSPTSLAFRGALVFPGPCPELGCFGSEYTFSGFSGLLSEGYKDVLRLLFAGVHHNGVKDCASPIRRALVADYKKVFDGNCSTPGQCAKGLTHIYRPADSSAVTPIFLELLGLPSVDQKPFCNGTSDQDRDPVRIACSDADQVCSNSEARDKTNGLLLTSSVPESQPDTARYADRPCDFGEFRLAAPNLLSPGFCRNSPNVSCEVDPECATGPCVTEVCADGSTAIGGLCLAPIHSDGPGLVRFDCLNISDNLSPLQSVLADGRVFNNYVYSPEGMLRSDQGGSKIVGARYRIRQTDCRRANTDDQIACLTSSDTCSLGLSRRVVPPTGSRSLSINGVSATDDNVRKVVTDPANSFPLASPYYVNTFVGFDQVTDPKEAALATCYLDPGTLRNIAPQQGLVALQDGRPGCRDFDETKCNNIACTANSECQARNLGQCLGGTCAVPCTSGAQCTGGRSCLAGGRCGYPINTNSCVGSVSFEGRLTLCPEITFVLVSPLQASVGSPINVSVTAKDADGDALSYLWTATAGSFQSPTSASTKYNCESAGTQRLTVKVTDSYCDKTRTIDVVCAN